MQVNLTDEEVIVLRWLITRNQRMAEQALLSGDSSFEKELSILARIDPKLAPFDPTPAIPKLEPISLTFPVPKFNEFSGIAKVQMVLVPTPLVAGNAVVGAENPTQSDFQAIVNLSYLYGNSYSFQCHVFSSIEGIYKSVFVDNNWTTWKRVVSAPTIEESIHEHYEPEVKSCNGLAEN